MQIVIFDSILWDYNVDTPARAPLGGSQSAVCFLAKCLAEDGQDVWIINNGSISGPISGVNHMPMRTARTKGIPIPNFDCCIILNDSRIVGWVRQMAGPQCPVVLWVQSNTDARSVAPLAERDVVEELTAIAFVSDWQRQRFLAEFSLPKEKTRVLRNAVAPYFESQFNGVARAPRSKTAPPEIVYASMPHRGLSWLVECWPEIHRRVPAARLNVFSSNSTYQSADDEDAKRLFDRCRTTSGVNYCSAVSQPELAERMKGAAILAYPSIFAETSCITALQAMASGMLIVASDYGALPETTSGFARLVPDISNKADFLSRFVDAVCDSLERVCAADAELEHDLKQQVELINTQFTWHRRAQELVEWLTHLRHESEVR